MKVLRSIRDSITGEAELPARVFPSPEPVDLGSRDRNRSRRAHEVRKATVSVKRMTKRDLEIGRLLNPPLEDVAYPETRGDCVDGERPCPFVRCKWHLYLDVSSRTGAITLNFPNLEPDEIPVTCALDVAERRGATLEQVAFFMNMTRERVRQIEVRAISKLGVAASALRDLIDKGDGGKMRLRVFEPMPRKRGDAVARAAGAERELADHDATSPALGFAGEDVRSALAAADWEEP